MDQRIGRHPGRLAIVGRQHLLEGGEFLEELLVDRQQRNLELVEQFGDQGVTVADLNCVQRRQAVRLSRCDASSHTKPEFPFSLSNSNSPFRPNGLIRQEFSPDLANSLPSDSDRFQFSVSRPCTPRNARFSNRFAYTSPSPPLHPNLLRPAGLSRL